MARVEPADDVSVARLVRPRDAQRTRLVTEPLKVARVGGRHRAENPDMPGEHDLGSRHPGQQGDLGVVTLDRQGCSELERPTTVARDDILLGPAEGKTLSLIHI